MTKTMVNSRRWQVALAVVFFVFVSIVVHGPAFSDEKNEASSAPGFEKARRLEGQWIRPDGGYVLALKDIEKDGRIQASYFNPQKINVHESVWRFTNGEVYVLVELRDVNYPGSKYALTYDQNNDILIGAYFQAISQQTFEVYFVRRK